MKKITKSISGYYAPVKLFIDDLETIVAVMKEVVVDAQIVISTEDYEFASPEELKQLNLKVIRRLSINASSHFMPIISLTVSLNSRGVYISCSHDNQMLRGALMTLEHLVRARSRKWLWVRYVHFGASVLSLNGAMVFGIYGLLDNNASNLYASCYLFVALLILIALYVATKPFRESEVVIARRHEYITFSERNRDIIIAVLTVALGVIGTLIVQAILG